MDEEFSLPWDPVSLETLLRQIISRGESAKVDLKAALDLSGEQQKGELLKDIAALANTYSQHYRNHGFIIFGASQGKIAFASFPADPDHLQATIDDLVTKYLRPFIPTHFYVFTEGGNTWGALVVPPTRNPPHVFSGQIHKRNRGDVYVRSGTTTEKAQPEDYGRFFRQHLEEHTHGLQQNIVDLQRDLAKLMAKVKKLESARSSRLQPTVKVPETIPLLQSQVVGLALTDRIEATLSTPQDQIAGALFEETRKINDYLDSDAIPWVVQSVDREFSKRLTSGIETVCSEFWSAVMSLVSRDAKGIYDDVLLKALSHLARQAEAPPNMTYNHPGRALRYFPLVVAFYLTFIVGVDRKRDKLLRRVLKLTLRGRSHYDEPVSALYALFDVRNAAPAFHPLHDAYPEHRWCDPIASYTKLLIDRILAPDDPLWDKEAAFYLGEFILCLSPIDLVVKETGTPQIGHPSSGLFLFMNSAQPVITRFLREDRDWIQGLFERPLEEILAQFDQTAHQLAHTGGCWGSGFVRGAIQAAYPDRAKLQ